VILFLRLNQKKLRRKNDWHAFTFSNVPLPRIDYHLPFHGRKIPAGNKKYFIRNNSSSIGIIFFGGDIMNHFFGIGRLTGGRN
jgi:hypothetical protein